nr:MAG TPA: minor capsid protein 2 [Caudoviricetes sp.]
MKITEKAWVEYITKMSQISQKAADLMQSWVQKNGLENDKALLDYAYALSQHYGQAIGALACRMYEATAAAQGTMIPTAEVAELPEYGEVAKAVKGTQKKSPNNIPGTIARLVKQVGADTTLKNAERDGAQFAWVPHGDTCAFCITLASRGWQYMSKSALRNGHAEHIHAHCDCEYAVRFDGESTVDGYDPDKYLEEYYDSNGDINKMRRKRYAQNKDAINARKRELYASKKAEKLEKNEAI